MQIVGIKKVETEPVFDITVENEHHYILENGVVCHNSGLKYAASNILYLSKKKFREDKLADVSGVIIHCKTKKSRLTKENQKVDVLLTYDKGLHRYEGLLELAEKYEIFKKKTRGYEMPDGSTAYDKDLRNNPEKYYTDEVLKQLDAVCKTEFLYGTSVVSVSNEDKEILGEETDGQSNDLPKKKIRKK